MGWDYYNDCPTEEFTEYQLEEHDKQIRADAIDEFVHEVKEHHYVLHILSDFMNCEDYGMFTIGIEQIAEELKAGVKDE